VRKLIWLWPSKVHCGSPMDTHCLVASSTIAAISKRVSPKQHSFLGNPIKWFRVLSSLLSGHGYKTQTLRRLIRKVACCYFFSLAKSQITLCIIVSQIWQIFGRPKKAKKIRNWNNFTFLKLKCETGFRFPPSIWSSLKGIIK